MKPLLALACLCAFVLPASAQSTGSLLSSPVVISNATTTSLGTATAIQVPYKGASFTLLPRFSAAGVGTSNVVFTFNLSRDGSTYTTTGPLSYTLAANGTNGVVGLVTFDATNFANDVRWIKWTALSTTQTNNLTVSALDWTCSPFP